MSVLDEIKKDINKNYFISASAGTGKTYTITHYYVEILKQYEKQNFPDIVDEIVVVTFTKKAASEMKERIFDLVNDQLEKSSNTDYWQKVKNNLSRAIISTIDSFCQRILREENINAKVDPNFTIINNAKMDKFLDKAVYMTLKYVFQVYDFGKADITLNISSERKRNIESYLLKLGEYKDELRTLFVEKFDNISSIMNILKNTLKLWRTEMKRATVFEKLFEVKEKESKELEVFKFLILIAKEIYEAFTIDNFEFDFKAVLEITLDFLEDKEMQEKYQKRFKYIIIDEFQDTNHLQKELFYKIHGDNNYLFIVGDRKQSIYRFRNADVSVFLETQNEFEEKEKSTNLYKVLPLKENYRSNEVLVKYFNFISENKIFNKHIIKKDDNKEIDRFSTFEAISPKIYEKLWYIKDLDESIPKVNCNGIVPILNNIPSRIKYVMVKNVEKENKGRKKSDKKTEIEAMVSAYIIKKLVGQKMTVKDKEKGCIEREIKYSDFAILRSSLYRKEDVYKKVFKKFNIPLHVVSSKGFFERIEVKAILNALNAVQNPNNDFYFTQFFFSPLVLGTFNDYRLIVKKNKEINEKLKETDKDKSVKESLFQTAKKIKFENEEINKALKILEKYSDLKYYVRPAEVLKGLIKDLNYFEKLAYFEDYKNAILNVKKLVLEASTIDQMAESFSQLVKLIEKLSNESESEASIEDETSDSVKLMTIHASKGLEFKIVLLGDLHSKGKKGSNSDIKFAKEKGKTYYMLSKIFEQLDNEAVDSEEIFEAIKHFYKDEVYDETEERRKLYVAITRASEMFIPIILDEPSNDLLSNYVKLSEDETKELKKLIGDFEQVDIDAESIFNMESEKSEKIIEIKDVPEENLKDLKYLSYKSYVSPTTLYGYLENEKEAQEEDIILAFSEKTAEGTDIHRKLASVNAISDLKYLEEMGILKVNLSDKLKDLFSGATRIVSEWRIVKPYEFNDKKYMLFGIPDKVLFKGDKIYVLDFKNVSFEQSKNIEKYIFQVQFYMYLLKEFGIPEAGYIVSTKTGEIIEVELKDTFEEQLKRSIENFEKSEKVKI